MEDNLFPEEDIEIIAEELDDEEDSPVGYVESIFFDEKTGDLARDGQNKLRKSTGLEAWEQWCINCLLTEKDAHPAYGSAFGISTYEAFKTDDRSEAESILTLEITEALMNDPYGRTQMVESIEYDWITTSECTVTVTVQGIEDVTIDITTAIDQRAR